MPLNNITFVEMPEEGVLPTSNEQDGTFSLKLDGPTGSPEVIETGLPVATCAVILPLTPDEVSAKELDSQSRKCNWLYNHLIEKSLQLREEYVRTRDADIGRVLYSKTGLRNLIPALKTTYGFLKEIHSSPLKNVGLRISTAIRARQKSKKRASRRSVGWPGFRSWGRDWFSLEYEEPNKGFSIEGDRLKLSLGLGEERKRRHLLIPMGNAEILKGKVICGLRIVKRDGRYFAHFTVRKELPQPKPITKIIALDPNHKNLAYGMDNHGQALEIAAPYWLKIYDLRLDELKARRDRCQRKAHWVPILDKDGTPSGRGYWKPSRQWIRRNGVYATALAKRRVQSKEFIQTVTNRLFKEYDVVAIGDYTPHGGGCTRGMRRGMNNRSLIGRFKAAAAWAAKKAGKYFHEYNEKGTTRTCHECKHVVSGGLEPSIRMWRCPCCESCNHRDETAARNGLAKVFQDLRELLQEILPDNATKPIAVTTRRRWRVSAAGIAVRDLTHSILPHQIADVA